MVNEEIVEMRVNIATLRVSTDENTKDLATMSRVVTEHMKEENKRWASIDKKLNYLIVVMALLVGALAGVENIPALLTLF